MTEHDPNGRSAKDPGSKLDAGKPPIFRGVLQYFPQALKAVAEVSAYGAQKYTWNGWRTVPDGFERYSDACLRHLGQEAEGEERDRDTQFLHAAHTAWNALARLELMLRDYQETTRKIGDLVQRPCTFGVSWSAPRNIINGDDPGDSEPFDPWG